MASDTPVTRLEQALEALRREMWVTELQVGAVFLDDAERILTEWWPPDLDCVLKGILDTLKSWAFDPGNPPGVESVVSMRHIEMVLTNPPWPQESAPAPVDAERERDRDRLSEHFDAVAREFVVASNELLAVRAELARLRGERDDLRMALHCIANTPPKEVPAEPVWWSRLVREMRDQAIAAAETQAPKEAPDDKG